MFRYLLVSALVASGCAFAEVGDEPFDEEEIYLEADNGIQISNGLNLANGLKLPNGSTLANGVNLGNGIDLPNGIDLANGIKLPNGITGPYFAPPAGSGLEQWIDVDPAMRKKIMRYLVECALPSGTSVQLLYRGRLETLGHGLYNLGPSLRAGRMNTIDQERVSGCLLARVNARGELVTVDMFGPYSGFNSGSQAELNEFSYLEGAFYGNIFLATPAAWSCTASAYQVDACRLRACKSNPDGSCNCGVIQLAIGYADRYGQHTGCTGFYGGYSYGGASCATATITGTTSGYFSSCTGGTVRYAYPMTTRLKPLASGQTCVQNTQCATGVCNATTGKCN